ncbi:MAG TPA: hypothetical protein VMU84_05450 [Thermoanaerobaculia bacterium]|nr:hypothetical protein [Thermoanaerobaculia bacterium]
MTQRIRTNLATAALFLALSIAMTWPLGRCLSSAVSDPGDPYINIWILDWDFWATLHQPLSLFHANIFHPAKYALASSENLYDVALLLMPFRVLGVGPVAAHNIAVILGFAFSGFAAYLLGRMLTGSWLAGFAAGVFYAFLPFRFVHFSHVQHIWGGWLALMLAALLWYVGPASAGPGRAEARPTWKRASGFGFVFLMNGLTNIHWFLFGSFAIALTIVLLTIRGERRWLRLFITTSIALALLTPFLYPYWAAAKLYHAERTWAETLQYSATFRDWLFANAEPERCLFPGVIALIVAVLVMWKRDTCRRESFSIAILWIVIGFMGSLGLNAFFHSALFNVVPGFRAVRAPARWAMIAYVGIAILIALATAALTRWRVWTGALIATALLVELWQAPIRLYSITDQQREVDAWLATTPIEGAMIELPIDSRSSESEAMFYATAHHRRIVNGLSGFNLPQHKKIVALAHQTQIPDAFVDELARAGVEFVVVHADAIDAREWLRRELDRGRLHFLRRFNGGLSGDWLFSLHDLSIKPIDDVDPFLRGEVTYSSTTIGVLDNPSPGEILGKRPFFSGWALAPDGIRSVEFRFNNGGIRKKAILIAEPSLLEKFPGYPNVPRPRFVASFDKRPRGVRKFTDVQVAITDGGGKVTLLPDRWIVWP